MAKVYMYGEIGPHYWQISAKYLQRELDALDEDEPIELYVNSLGGDVFEAYGVMSLLSRREGQVTAYVDGVAASAASMVILAADKVVMPENTMLMIHNPWSVALGDYRDMDRAGKMLESVRDSMVTTYKARTGKGEEELKALLDDTTWMTAKEAVENGFADEMSDAIPKAKLEDRLAIHDTQALSQAPEAIVAVAMVGRRRIAAMAAGTPRGKRMETKDKQKSSVASAAQASAQNPVPTPVNVEQVQADAEKAVMARISKIQEICASVGLDGEKALEIARDSKTIEQAQAMVINSLAKRDEKKRVSSANASVTVTSDGRDKFREGAVAALLMRGGVEDHDGQNPFRRMSLARLAEEAVVQAGGRPDGDQRAMVKQAMNVVALGGHSRSDFPNIMLDVMHKRLLAGYQEVPETWQQWCRQGSLNDFREASLVSLTIFDDLKKVSENGEYTYGTIKDRGETIQLGKFGRMFRLSYEMIVDDNLRALIALPAKMGRSAARVPGDLVYTNILQGNPAMKEDNTALFHATHNNTSNEALDYEALEKRRVAMVTQSITTSEGTKRALGIRPRFLIVPPQLHGKAMQVMTSEFEDADLQPNRVRGLFEIIEEPRLGGDPAAYYLAADGRIQDTIEVAFRDGISTPQIEQQSAWNVDAIEFKVRFEVAAAPVDFRGLQRGGAA